ncbi:polysaccharide deacetylase family protein [Collinsella tanakaei]|nr:polysaccharide deacetylase family protein [Collinsella tanakaei]MBM6784900.1 polysaccharide deacetylase family protein [Collinsella tanakaei]
MVMWDESDTTNYEVLKSESVDGPYEVIGNSDNGSYLDSDASWPTNEYYKIRGAISDDNSVSTSNPVQAGTNEQHVTKVPILLYHNFVSEEDQENGVVFDEYSITPAEFEQDLQYLNDNGYSTITSEDLLAYIYDHEPLPEQPILLSIDDGTWGVYKHAWPLLKKFEMKADFNVVGSNIDASWNLVHNGGSREGESAPYCEWDELKEMVSSGEIYLCSHTYGLHSYHSDGRIGASMIEGEDISDYIDVIKRDYELSASCIEGWTGNALITMAYPYSERSQDTDSIILANTGYEFLMGGTTARGTRANYFVDGASHDSQLRIMSRTSRMTGTPIEDYLEAIDAHDVLEDDKQS